MKESEIQLDEMAAVPDTDSIEVVIETMVYNTDVATENTNKLLTLIKDQQERIAELRALCIKWQDKAIVLGAENERLTERIAELEADEYTHDEVVQRVRNYRRGYNDALDAVLALPRIKAIKGGNGYEWIEEEGEDGRYVRVSDIEEKLREATDGGS